MLAALCQNFHVYLLFARGSGCEVLWWVCLSVCLSTRISSEPHMRSIPNFLCMLPVSMARSSSDMFMIGRIAYHREWVFFPVENALSAGKGGGGGSAQRGQSMMSMIDLLLLHFLLFSSAWVHFLKLPNVVCLAVNFYGPVLIVNRDYYDYFSVKLPCETSGILVNMRWSSTICVSCLW